MDSSAKGDLFVDVVLITRMKPRPEFVRKEDRQASALLQTAAEGSRTATALEQQPAQEADGVCHGLLHLGHRVPVREGDEGVRQRAVDVHVAVHAHAPDARVEVDRVVEQRVEAAHLVRVRVRVTVRVTVRVRVRVRVKG